MTQKLLVFSDILVDSRGWTCRCSLMAVGSIFGERYHLLLLIVFFFFPFSDFRYLNRSVMTFEAPSFSSPLSPVQKKATSLHPLLLHFILLRSRFHEFEFFCLLLTFYLKL